ncbi:glycosyl transferase, group 1 family [Luminiphilus syltensis NOR5-1B]|uniref:Glycosyl transferase, group 1 family n=2 Tax=Luminiphilus TaxID=1341118 RepID=B8KQP6_9GAMM|nr:glycosyl transferase, group 1 family [Luminiphilus syltensis NOR5-1B]
MITNLCTAVTALGVRLDILLVKAEGPYVEKLPASARLIRLRTGHTATSVVELALYLRRERPDALLAVKHRAIVAAVRARRLARVDTPIGGRLGTTVTAALEGKSERRKRLWFDAMRTYYPAMQAIIPVSEGVASDIAHITGLRRDAMTVIANPVITPELFRLADAPSPHPWFDEEPPVIIGVGRLTAQKDFPTLLEAFALLRKTRNAHLIILGDGEQRESLQRLAEQLGIADDIGLPGFQKNPWAWMSRSRVFVLSSRWEGSPNTLSEALALGVPVVATDCPSGPREVLDGGVVAPLVPMGDAGALASGMEQMLNSPPPPEILKAAVSAYHAEASARAYLRALGLSVNGQ